jgi:uncharacterized Fe-S cluster-containing MiaB family protein
MRKQYEQSRAWWYMPIIPVLRRLRQVDHKFQASLGYRVRSCLEKGNNKEIGTDNSSKIQKSILKNIHMFKLNQN